METAQLLQRMKRLLAEEFGARFKGLVLFGSLARGAADESSDIDLLVLLEEPLSLGKDLERVVSCTYGEQMLIDRSIHFTLARRADFEAGEFSLYRLAKREGVFA